MELSPDCIVTQLECLNQSILVLIDWKHWLICSQLEIKADGLDLVSGDTYHQILVGNSALQKMKVETARWILRHVTWWECLSFLIKASWHCCLVLRVSEGSQDHILCLIICLVSGVSFYTFFSVHQSLILNILLCPSGEDSAGITHKTLKIKILCDLGKFSWQFLNHVTCGRK